MRNNSYFREAEVKMQMALWFLKKIPENQIKIGFKERFRGLLEEMDRFISDITLLFIVHKK